MEILDEVTAQVGQGMMHGVSRARDVKPKRTVARRQLPVPFGAMVEDRCDSSSDGARCKHQGRCETVCIRAWQRPNGVVRLRPQQPVPT